MSLRRRRVAHCGPDASEEYAPAHGETCSPPNSWYGGPGATPEAPTAVAAAVDAAGTLLTITFSEPVSGNTGFTLTADAVGRTLSAPANDGRIITFTCEAVATGETCLLSYAPGNVVDQDSTALATFSDMAVTNNVPA